MTLDTNDPWIDKREALRIITQEASQRPVVPFLGAGIPISAGFPTIRFVVQYLAKVDFSIRLGVFEDRFPTLEQGQKAVETYRRHPSKYLEDFGWPDLGQLDADLWNWLGRVQKDPEIVRDYNGEGRRHWEDSSARQRVAGTNKRAILDLLANDVTPKPIWDVGRSTAPPRPLEIRDHLRAIVQWTLRQDLADREGGTARATLREWRRWKAWYFGRPGLEPELLYGDWETLLDRLCEGSFDLTDTLFTSFELGRSPTLSHRYLAFLQRKLGVPLVLTTNFDSLLERALREEGVVPKVFDVHRDAELPDAALVRRQISVLKLHGSAYGLRLGERLKYPLDADARNDALRYVPRDALVLVMGFSGSERRIMQLLHAVAREESLGSRTPRLIWIQGPGNPGPLFHELVSGPPGSVRCCRVGHIDTFLQELYFQFANSYQSSARGYSTLPGRPQSTELHPQLPVVAKSADPATGPTAGGGTTGMHAKEVVVRSAHDLIRRPVHVCLAAGQQLPERSTSWASLAGAAFTSSLDYGYTVIWIDLENHHTVEGIVAEFFDRVRMVDPQAPTCTITDLHAGSSKAIDKAVRRIREVFQRGRYVLVLDSVESFGRPQMMHHGMPSYDLFRLASETAGDFGKRRSLLEQEFTRRVNNLALFMRSLLHLDSTNLERDLAEHPYLDSHVVVTVDEPRLRYRYRGAAAQDQPLTFRVVRDNLVEPLRALDDAPRPHICVHRQAAPGYEGLIVRPEHRPAAPDPSGGLPPHWRYPASEEPRDRVEHSGRRAKDILDLLGELRTARGGGGTQFSNGAAAAFVSLMSVFRRSRSLPMLRSIIERWGLRNIGGGGPGVMSRATHEAVDGLLGQLSTAGASPVGLVAQLHEGGTLWLFREVHEATYDALTESLHVRDWITSWHKKGRRNCPSGTSRAAALLDGLTSVTWHLYAARTYYADVFMPTRDIRAFYEYLYHRVAASRTVTLLIAILETDRKRAFSELKQHLTDLLGGGAVPAGLGSVEPDPLSWYVEAIGVFAPIAGNLSATSGATNPRVYDASALLSALQDLRRHALETLLMALTRNRLLLRAVATPDTVLAWSRQFLDRELDDIEGTSLKLVPRGGSVKSLYDLVAPGADVQDTIDALRNLFHELHFKAELSKLDFEGVLRSIADGAARGGSPQTQADEAVWVATLIADRIAWFSGSAKAFDETHADGTPSQEAEAALRCAATDLLRVSRCLLHLRDHRARNLTQAVLDGTRSLLTAGSQSVRGWAKKLRRDALELCCKSRFDPWPLWQPLLERSSSDSRKHSPELLLAEKESIAYEDTLRETSETNEDDARHRSSALALRARALYLRGHFRQAHHFLDLASAGLLPERLDHRTAISVVHLVRAELLSISAHEHYCSGSKHDHTSPATRPPAAGPTEAITALAERMLPEVAGSLKKIERAEHELSRAEESLRGLAHQNIWLIHLEFGWAQLTLERMLFETEALFWSWRRLGVTEYLQKSGWLEQHILNGMRRLRNVLDLIPFRPDPWKEVADRLAGGSAIVQIECMLYKLWRQYFVAGAYYSSLLSNRYRDTIPVTGKTVSDITQQVIPCLTGLALAGSDAARYRERWKLWCRAMRFDYFGDNVQLAKTLSPGSKEPDRAHESSSLRSAVIQAMLDECQSEDIFRMWDTRRRKSD